MVRDGRKQHLLNEIIAGQGDRLLIQEPPSLLVNKLLHILQIWEPMIIRVLIAFNVVITRM
jgi:hypothetical protein